MAPPEVDFRTIRPHRGTQNGGFEELCCQLAALEGAESDLFFRKGAGVDQGVECYRRHADRSETAWQAKFFTQGFGANQAADLDESLTRALAAHPALATYVVCLPLNLSDNRGKGRRPSDLQRYEAWRQRRVDQARAGGRTIEITLWSATSIAERLGRDDPRYSGRLRYWFDLKRLSAAWFTKKFERQRDNLGQRYTPDSHVEVSIEQVLRAVARDLDLLNEPNDWAARIRSSSDALRNELSAVELDALERLFTATGLLSARLEGRIDPSRPVPLDEWNALVDAAEHALHAAFAIVRGWGPARESGVQRPLFKLVEAIEKADEALGQPCWRLVNRQSIVIVGPPGIGKSHLIADFGARQVALGRPFVLILTGTLVDGDPWPQIREQLDIGSLSTEELLGALDAAAEAAGCRAVVSVDALNERNGLDVWETRLHAFVRDIGRFSRLCVVLTVRDTYRHRFPLDNIEQVRHSGFAGRSSEAAKAYLDRRGIARPTSPHLSREFENPLFVRTCCDYLELKGLRELPRGVTGVSKLFDFYIEASAEQVNRLLTLDPHQEIPQKALNAFLQAVASSEDGALPKDRAQRLFEEHLQSGGRADRSLFSAFLSEGLLTLEVTRAAGDDLEYVRFTFERLYDHLRARHLLATGVDPVDVVGSFQRSPLDRYVGPGAHWSCGGVVEAIATQLPEQFGNELFDVAPANAIEDTGLVSAFESSIVWRNPACFTQATLRWAEKVSEIHGHSIYRYFLLVCSEPDNRFNASHLHERLSRIPMPERDADWSVFLAENDLERGDAVHGLIDWAWEVDAAAVDPRRTLLAGIALTWCFSTSHREVRDLATKALVNLLASRLALASDLLVRFAPVDDPYVTERLLAACYGAALQRVDRDGFRRLVEQVWQQYFVAGRQPPVHLLARDYALGILELGRAWSALPEEVDLDRCLGPHATSWPLDVVSPVEANSFREDGYRDAIASSTGRDGDFGRYTIGSWVTHITQLPRTLAGQTTQDLFEAWQSEFLDSAEPAQLEHYVALRKATVAYRIRPRTERTFRVWSEGKDPGESLLAEVYRANERFRTNLDGPRLDRYAQIAERYLIESTRMGRDDDISPPEVDEMEVGRWVCKRAHEMGWSARLHRAFDSGRMIARERMGKHRVERIGKKYQRIALAEVTARLTDHLAVSDYDDRGRLRAFRTGPASLSLMRDIDPSLLVRSTQETGWSTTPTTWWTPAAPILPKGSTAAMLSWLQRRENLCDGEEHIDVVSPDGHRWLNLDVFRHWEVPGTKHRNHAEAWSRITCLVSRAGDGARLAQELARRERCDRHSMPYAEDITGFLGEHGWRNVMNVAPLEPYSWGGIKTPCASVTASYSAGGRDADNSIDESFSIGVASGWLLRTLGLHLQDGRRPRYLDAQGSMRLFDPSLEARGPTATLASRDYFIDGLNAAGLEPVWVIAGEKNVYSPQGVAGPMGFGGRFFHTCVLHLENGRWVEAGRHFEFSKPSREQLDHLWQSSDEQRPTDDRQPD